MLQRGNNEIAEADTCVTQLCGFATQEVLQKIFYGNGSKTYHYQVTQKNLYDGEDCYIRIGDNSVRKILDRMKNEAPLGTICNVNQGIVTGADKVQRRHIDNWGIRASIGDGIFVLTKQEIESLNLTQKELKILKPWFKNSNIAKYHTTSRTNEYVIYLDGKNTEESIPNILSHLLRFKANLQERREVHNGSRNWYDLWWSRLKSVFDEQKIVAPVAVR